MEKNFLLNEELVRIQEIMGVKLLNEGRSSRLWYLQLIEELLPTLSKVPKWADELVNFRFMIQNAKNEDELENVAKMLFSKNRPYYPELIQFVRRTYAQEIAELKLNLTDFGKRMMDQGASIDEVMENIDIVYSDATKNSPFGNYMGEELASEIKNAAKDNLSHYTPVVRPTITSQDLALLIDSYKKDPTYAYLFQKYGPQIEMELQQAQEIFKLTNNYSEFARQVDQAIKVWSKSHPLPPSFWVRAGNFLKKTFLSLNKQGGLNIPWTLFRWFVIILSTAWFARGAKRYYWGETAAEAWIKSASKDVSGAVGAVSEFFVELFRMAMGDKPKDIKPPKKDQPITPDDVNQTKEKY